MKIHSMSCYSNQEANGTWDVRSTLNMIVDSVQDVGAFQRAWQAFVESVAAPAVQDAVIAEPEPAPAPVPEPVVVAPAPQAEDVVVYATPAAPVMFTLHIPDPVVHIENNTTPAPEPVPEPAPVVVEEAPKQKRTRKKAEPEPVPAAAPAPAPDIEDEEQADLFGAAQPTKVAVGTVKVGEHTFACTYAETGVYITCRVSLPAALADKLGVEPHQFSATGDTKKDAASLVAEEIQDYLEVQSWLKKPVPEPTPAPAPAPEPEPAPAPVPAKPELTAADNPFIPPEVLRIMMESRKLTDSAVRSEVVTLWCRHIYEAGITDAQAILDHMEKHQTRLTMFEKKPMGTSVPRLVHTLVEGYNKPQPQKRTTFKAEAPEAVTVIPGDELDEEDIPY
jgi:hypothetical protein